MLLVASILGLLSVFALRAGSDQRLWGRTYRSAPRPVGMVLRAPLARVAGPLQRFRVEPVPGASGDFRVHFPAGSASAMRLVEFSYPDGARRELADQLPITSAPGGRSAVVFDFNGDGVLDTVRNARRNWEGRVEVISGVDGRILLRDDDPLEHEDERRGFPLGDLDGDGFGELALVHPRTDRSAYDLEPLDAISPPHSWVTVVSGARLFGPR